MRWNIFKTLLTSATQPMSTASMHPKGRCLTTPVQLILDWDGTLTTKDTMSMLGRLPMARDYRLHNQHHQQAAIRPLSRESGSMSDKVDSAIRKSKPESGPAHPSDTKSHAPAAAIRHSYEQQRPAREKVPTWDSFSKAYMSDYSAHKSKHFPASSDQQAYRVRSLSAYRGCYGLLIFQSVSQSLVLINVQHRLDRI